MNFWESDPIVTPGAAPAAGAAATPDPTAAGAAPVPTGDGASMPALPQYGLAGGPGGGAGGGGIVRVPGGGIIAMPPNNAEPAYMTDLAKDQVEFRRATINNAKEAQRTDAALGQFQTAMQEMKARGTETGYFTPALAQLAAGAKSLGIDTSAFSGMPKPEDVGDAQTAQKVSKMIFGEVLRKLFPLRSTNMDIKVMEGIAPGLGIDERANENLMSAISGQNAYDKGIASKMLDYEAEHRGLYGFERQHYKENGYGPLSFAYTKQGGASQPAAADQGAANGPAPVQGAKQAPDGNWYLPDPNRSGKYLMVKPGG